MKDNYIQYAEGYNKNNINFSDIEKAIIDVQEADDEHCAFWVAVMTEDENVIETTKYLDLTIVFEENETNYKAKDWNEVKEFYQLLLEEKFDIIKEKIK
ncbi:hypothetical protein [Chryseobacterium potabilaquae]|uniref:Uncharacterized protein n=1 Tax=Chryseobacterium potabilaquae TaxID=2675057 RepID=A0A6N4XC13_9FLAO|nr:hypothetical protein [Chryseobacterium potabilaquae]CAA7197201.1 hypothetical protein CHRY9293_03255 [Chryseobacterium potabilaquae]